MRRPGPGRRRPARPPAPTHGVAWPVMLPCPERPVVSATRRAGTAVAARPRRTPRPSLVGHVPAPRRGRRRQGSGQGRGRGRRPSGSRAARRRPPGSRSPPAREGPLGRGGPARQPPVPDRSASPPCSGQAPAGRRRGREPRPAGSRPGRGGSRSASPGRRYGAGPWLGRDGRGCGPARGRRSVRRTPGRRPWPPRPGAAVRGKPACPAGWARRRRCRWEDPPPASRAGDPRATGGATGLEPSAGGNRWATLPLAVAGVGGRAGGQGRAGGRGRPVLLRLAGGAVGRDALAVGGDLVGAAGRLGQRLERRGVFAHAVVVALPGQPGLAQPVPGGAGRVRAGGGVVLVGGRTGGRGGGAGGRAGGGVLLAGGRAATGVRWCVAGDPLHRRREDAGGRGGDTAERQDRCDHGGRRLDTEKLAGHACPPGNWGGGGRCMRHGKELDDRRPFTGKLVPAGRSGGGGQQSGHSGIPWRGVGGVQPAGQQPVDRVVVHGGSGTQGGKQSAHVVGKSVPVPHFVTRLPASPADSSRCASRRSPRWASTRTAPGRLPMILATSSTLIPPSTRRATTSAWSCGSSAIRASAARVDSASSAAVAGSSGPARCSASSSGSGSARWRAAQRCQSTA